jgi:hypothetical protein
MVEKKAPREDRTVLEHMQGKHLRDRIVLVLVTWISLLGK